MHPNAPYASIAIPLSLQSTVGFKYRSYSCYECGRSFLERENEHVYRVGDPGQPQEAHVGPRGDIQATCGNCLQTYSLRISLIVQAPRIGIPLYMQPQTIYIASEPTKKLRDVHCGECGKAYFSISDRIKLVVDNVNPVEALDMARAGPMEARCNFAKCKQRWYIRV